VRRFILSGGCAFVDDDDDDGVDDDVDVVGASLIAELEIVMGEEEVNDLDVDVDVDTDVDVL